MKYEYTGDHKTIVDGSTVRTGGIVELKSLENMNPNHWKKVKEELTESKEIKKKGGK